MEIFRKFINSGWGQLIWLFLIYFVLLTVQFRPLTWILTGLMGWFAVHYSNSLVLSKHQNLWKLLVVLNAPVVYLVFVIQMRLTAKKAPKSS